VFEKGISEQEPPGDTVPAMRVSNAGRRASPAWQFECTQSIPAISLLPRGRCWPRSFQRARPLAVHDRRPCAGSATGSCMGCAVAAPGALSRGTTVPGKPSPITVGSGAAMAQEHQGPDACPLRELARIHAGRGPRPPRVRPFSIARQSRPSWAAYAAMRGTRSWAAANGQTAYPGGYPRLRAFGSGPRAQRSRPCRRPMGEWVLQAAGGSFPRLQQAYLGRSGLHQHTGTLAHQHTGTLVRWAAQEDGWTVQGVDSTDRQLQRYAPLCARIWVPSPGSGSSPNAGGVSAPFPGWGGNGA
jgi:hypothetical protein